MNLILIAILSLGAIGAISAIILYLVAQKFKIYEDPRNALVTEVLPGANCGGCGYPGCQGFADACVKSESLEGMMCPVGGTVVMSKVANILGKEIVSTAPMIATVKCNVQSFPLFMPEKPDVLSGVLDVEIVLTHVSSMLYISIQKHYCQKSMRKNVRHVGLV